MTLSQIEDRIKVLKIKEADFFMFDAQEELDRCRMELADMNRLMAAEIESQAVVEDMERLAAESKEDAEYLVMVEQSKHLQEYLEYENEIDDGFEAWKEEQGL